MGIILFIILLVLIIPALSSSGSSNQKDENDIDREIDELIMYDEIFDDEDDF